MLQQQQRPESGDIAKQENAAVAAWILSLGNYTQVEAAASNLTLE
jgi:hypothetical protein